MSKGGGEENIFACSAGGVRLSVQVCRVPELQQPNLQPSGMYWLLVAWLAQRLGVHVTLNLCEQGEAAV